MYFVQLRHFGGTRQLSLTNYLFIFLIISKCIVNLNKGEVVLDETFHKHYFRGSLGNVPQNNFLEDLNLRKYEISKILNCIKTAKLNVIMKTI